MNKVQFSCRWDFLYLREKVIESKCSVDIREAMFFRPVPWPCRQNRHVLDAFIAIHRLINRAVNRDFSCLLVV